MPGEDQPVDNHGHGLVPGEAKDKPLQLESRLDTRIGQAERHGKYLVLVRLQL